VTVEGRIGIAGRRNDRGGDLAGDTIFAGDGGIDVKKVHGSCSLGTWNFVNHDLLICPMMH
jgi:hypothetical protein